jgi:O-antigen/teichoic acid export membrane protein
MYVSIFIAILSKDFMPAIAEFGHENSRINEYIKKYILFLFFICLPIVLFLILFSRQLFYIFFSPEFYSGILLFEILCVVSFMKILLFPIGFAVLGIGDTHAFVRQGPVVLILNTILCFIALPRYGLISYSYISIICIIISCLWGYFYIRKINNFKLPYKYFIIFLFALVILFSTIYLKYTFFKSS